MSFMFGKTKAKNKEKGAVGEILAVNFLKKNKYKILQTNYKNVVGEIDIVAQKKKLLVFVEVKRRMTLEYGRPVEAVNLRKQNKIKKVAELFLIENNLKYADCRFDVIEILDEEVFHIENAFW